MSAGLGALSSFAVGVESAPLVAAAASVYYPIISEGLKADRTAVPSGSIVGDSMRQAVAMGVSVCEGNFQMEVEGSVSGHPIWLWNGNDGYTVDEMAAGAAYTNGAPTTSAGSGGTLANGAYKHAVSVVLNRTNDGQKIIMPGSAVSSAATTSTGQNTIGLSWTAPSDLPQGYTIAGYVIWRSLIGGSTVYFLKYQSGSTTSYSDTGSIALPNQNVTPYSASLYEHVMVGSPPVSGDRLTPFTCIVNHNNDYAQQFITCRMDSMKLAVSGLDDKLMADFSCKGAAAAKVANFTPTFVPLEPMLGWHCIIQMNGVPDQTLESFEIDCSNGVQVVPGMRGVAFNRDTISGARSITGQMTRQFQDVSLWLQMLAGLDFSLKFTSYGQCVANPVQHGLSNTMANSGIDALPFQMYLQIELPRCKISKAGGNISSPDRIIETVAFEAFKDQDTGTDMKITMHNTVAEYA